MNLKKTDINMNSIDKQYIALLQDILVYGAKKETRNGETISVFGRQIRHRMVDGFPLLTTKKVSFKTMVTELLWFLRGDTNIKYLVDNDCYIWVGDAYKRFDKHFNSCCEIDEMLTKEEFIERIKTDGEFAEKWSNLGPIYGKQWRSWVGYGSHVQGSISASTQFGKIDQIADVIHKLKTNPDDRGIIVSAWNVGELDQMVLRPCHNFFQFYTRELSFDERCDYAIKAGWMSEFGRFDFPETHYALDKAKTPKRAISLMYNARSQDVPLGTPFNIASYALLLEIVGKMVNMVPDELIANMGDCHIYKNQIDGIKEQLTREPYELPKLVHMKTDEFYNAMSEDLSLLSHLDFGDFLLENYQSHPAIKIPLSN